ncbi:hypothetical protein Poli38472_010457 [Pythium oligandrum]|uniref:C2H2-type domain-containing protein n=1 Tax=Pythium oligandrum TaxID=41045 RepID=A0A8K1F9T9_PYTOL|nr:hypothetical protein Poli38472_010457 [Pythium oligandrum]|eukprot:TMW55575.1 hypothetical protein Poli38472_010457 [Pythium oligandrum]
MTATTTTTIPMEDTSVDMATPPTTPTTEKPHQCASCEKAFKRLNDLQDHENTHTGAKPHECPREGCNSAFANRSNLKKHVTAIHQKEKPYQCPYDNCKKRFKHRNSLREHENWHMGIRSRKCDSCSEDFFYSKCLYRHKRAKHLSKQ